MSVLGLINHIRSLPHPEDDALGLWWVSQVVYEATMTTIEESIYVLFWLNLIIVQVSGQNCLKTVLVTAWLHVHILGSVDLIIFSLEWRERFPRHRGLAIPTCIAARAVMHVGVAN